MSFYKEKRVREGQRWAIKSSYYPYYRQRYESSVAARSRARVGRVYTHCRIMCTRVPCHHVSFQAREIDNLAENARSNRVFHRARVNSLVR